MILTGERGSGRSSFVNNLLRSRLSMNRLPVNHLLTPVQLQMDVKEKLALLDKKQKFLGGAKRSQQKHAFFLHNIHLASKSCDVERRNDRTGVSLSHSDSPLLELLRYMLSHKRLTDFSRSYEYLLISKFVVTSTPADYWRLPVKFTRGICRLPFLPPSDECLHNIFSKNMEPWLEAFPLGDVAQTANVC